jgi:two-component system OmpR family response regulator
MSMPHLLMIEDDTRLGGMVGEYLQASGYGFEQAPEGALGLRRVQQRLPDLVILDLMLPDMDGLAVCRQLRALPGAAGRVPVIMLTAKGDPMDRVIGLEMGADDYLPKPFEPRELVARVQAILRRRPAAHAVPDDGLLHFDGLVIDPVRRSVVRDGAEVDLTASEFELLLMLAREPGRVFSRDDILNQLRGHEAELYTRAVDIVVSRLRKKLEPLECIKTLRNAGYTLALRRTPP